MIKKISTETLWANTFRYAGRICTNLYSSEEKAVYQHKYRCRSAEVSESKVIRVTRWLKNDQSPNPPRIHDAESEEESTTSSTVYQTKVRVSLVVTEAAEFLISWSCEVKAYSGSVKLQVLHNDFVDLAEHCGENCGWSAVGGFKKLTLMPGHHTFDLDFSSSWGTAGIRRARVRAGQL